MLVRTLTKRSEFLAANRGLRFPVPGFVLLVRERGDGDELLGIGYTVSKKVGNAVTRNRMKRRLRALVREQLADNGIKGADHVLIGRPGGNDIAYSELGDNLSNALRRAAKKLQQRAEGSNKDGDRSESHHPRRRGKDSGKPRSPRPAQAIGKQAEPEKPQNESGSLPPTPCEQG